MTQSADSAAAAAPAAPLVAKRSWREALLVYTKPAVFRMLLLGFSAGLPLLLVLGTLSFWLREAGIDRATIGFLSWIGLAYGFKWLWAPLVDRLAIPGVTRALGRRRSWLLLAQAGVMAGLIGMALTDPKLSLNALVWFAVLVAFSSATQDIALDAFRIESAAVDEQAALSAAYQTGYRLAMIWAGAGVLWLAAFSQGAASGYAASAWTFAYLIMAASMLVGVITVLFSPEPVAYGVKEASEAQLALQLKLQRERKLHPTLARAAAWIHSAIIGPFMEFVLRFRWHAVLILALISVYRISDVVMGIMANPFYVDMGYTKLEVANISKVYGLIMTLVGAGLGGLLSMRYGVMRVLMFGAVMSALSNLLFSWLATIGHNTLALTLVISIDNLAGGIASAAFIAYMSSLTSAGYTATQYALFSSLMLLLPKFIAGFSGVFVDRFGYVAFFNSTAAIGVPVLILVWLAMRMKNTNAQTLSS
jgi:MFS transporter, PAT family, beta-lactamase induction signal transducer AmpG